MDKIVPRLKEGKISVVWASKLQPHTAKNNEKEIIKQILENHLPNLKKLIVYENRIENVEPIARMDLPLL